MAKELKASEYEHSTDIYDSDTGKSCVSEKIVDITDDCPMTSKKIRAFLLFTKVRKGRIVQIRTSYKGEMSLGSNVHNLMEVLDREIDAVLWNTFELWARELGLTKLQLHKLIVTHAPAI